MNEPEEKSEKQEEAKVSSLKTVTLKDLKSSLCLGTAASNHNKTLEIKPWKMKEEKELAKAKDELEGQSMTTYVSSVLSTLCTQFGEHNFVEMKGAQKNLALGQMWMADIFTAYCCIRLKALGKLIKMKPTCPRCRKPFDWTADLETVEVVTADTLKDCLWKYKLVEPFEIRGKVRSEFLMGPMRWSSLETMSKDGIDEAIAKNGTMLGSIHKVDGEEIVLAEHELDEMVKMDIETLSEEITERALGPNMSVECKCPRSGCNKFFKIPIDWTFDSFFGVSSQ